MGKNNYLCWYNKKDMFTQTNNYDNLRPKLHRNILMLIDRGLMVYDPQRKEWLQYSSTVSRFECVLNNTVLSEGDLFINRSDNAQYFLSDAKTLSTNNNTKLGRVFYLNFPNLDLHVGVNDFVPSVFNKVIKNNIASMLNSIDLTKINLLCIVDVSEGGREFRMAHPKLIQELFLPETLLCPTDGDLGTEFFDEVEKNMDVGVEINDYEDISGLDISGFTSIGTPIQEFGGINLSESVIESNSLENHSEKGLIGKPESLGAFGSIGEKDFNLRMGEKCEPESKGSTPTECYGEFYDMRGNMYTFVSSGDDRVIEYLAHVGLINEVVIYGNLDKVYATLKSNVMIGLDVLKEAGVSEINFTERKIVFTYDNSGEDFYSQAEYGFDELLNKVLSGDIYVRNYGMNEGRKLYIVKLC